MDIMKGSKRKKIIAIALVATLACSGSVTSAFAATNEGTGITNHTNVLPFADEATVAENEPTEEVESETQTELNEQKEHTEDEITVKEETNYASLRMHLRQITLWQQHQEQEK